MTILLNIAAAILILILGYVILVGIYLVIFSDERRTDYLSGAEALQEANLQPHKIYKNFKADIQKENEQIGQNGKFST